ncbi:alpha/beta fold hydrolase [Spongiimicrobium salis]|uniref:alpha/beta fold hydrolase n=1 Tax=Spongiimicrobium salis TaxID=1667022 RepID=UPI00374DB28A
MMRTSKKETKKLFLEENISYQDTVVSIQGRKIHYLQTGRVDAPTLVFVHGSPGSWDAFKGYLMDKDLLKRYRIIAMDRPGFGYSNFRRSLGLLPQAKLLNELLARLDNGAPYTLFGHSYGGPLIVQMALDKPQLYSNLGILAGALDPDAEKPERWRYPFRAFPLKYIVPGALRPSNDELILLKKELKNLKGNFENLTQNILIIHGTDDKLVPYQNVPYMEKEFTAAETLKVITLDKQNHFFIWSEKPFVIKSILEWLSGLETAKKVN